VLPTAASIVEKLPRPLRRHRLMTAWMRLTGESPLQLVRIRDSSFGYADMHDGFLRLIVIDQGFEKDFFSIADRLLAKGGTFLDIGANHGLLSFGLAGRHGTAIDFHLFEPNPKLVASIERTRALYPQMRCRVYPLAVTDRVGRVSFSINEQQTGASHIAANGGTTVATTSIDAYLDANAVARVDLAKLDIEGFELLALRGAESSLRSRRIEAVYFEYFEKYLYRVGAPPAEVIQFLDSVGFTTCFCRTCDYGPLGGPSHTLIGEASGLPLLPVEEYALPAMTDLMAVPRERLVSLAGCAS
jgi:FkbM family methyltransferase